MALKFRNEKDAQVFIDKGWGINYSFKNDGGQTALHKACSEDKTGKCVKKLIEAGADITIRPIGPHRHPISTPLELASSRCNIKAVEALLEAGAAKNGFDNEINRAITGGEKNAHQMIEFLIKNGAKVKPDSLGLATGQHKPFEDKKAVIDVLLENGSNINEVGGPEDTPLHSSLAYGDLKTARYLLEKGADPTYFPTGQTAVQNLFPALNENRIESGRAQGTEKEYLDFLDFYISKGGTINNPEIEEFRNEKQKDRILETIKTQKKFPSNPMKDPQHKPKFSSDENPECERHRI